MGFLLIALAFVVFNAIWAMSTVAACAALGMPVKTIGIFYGPALYSREAGYTSLKVGCIPLGAYVQPNELALKKASPLKKAFVRLFGAVWTWLFALVLLSPSVAIQDTLTCLPELFRVIPSPLERGKQLFAEVAGREPQEIFGWVAVRHAALALIPIPPVALGSALFDFFSGDQDKHAKLALYGTLFVVLPLYACLAIGLLTAAGEQFGQFAEWLYFGHR